QAEDGIRDRNVTGVQTCALPISVRWAPFGRRVLAAAALLPMTLHLAASFSRDSVLLGLAFAFTGLCLRAIFGDEGKPMAAPLARSEERRVGRGRRWETRAPQDRR